MSFAEDQSDAWTLSRLQRVIESLYGTKDQQRGVEGTFMWLLEEVGELAAALRGGTREEQIGEFADVLAWLATIANVVGIDLEEAIRAKYGAGCPGCGSNPCHCSQAEKP
jgi:NTP pyrophosphatase (non-canonical NTP hydrolase)